MPNFTCWVYPVATFPWNGQNMALFWPKYGPHMVIKIASSWILINAPRDFLCQFSHCWGYSVAPFPRDGKIWPFIAKTWSSQGPSNGFFLNLNQCPKGCSMPNFTLLAKSCSPLPRNDQNMALLMPKHGPQMVLQVGSSGILVIVPRDVPCQSSHSWIFPVAPFPKNGQNMAICCQNMVLTWS